MHAVEHHKDHPLDYLEHHHPHGRHVHDHHSEYAMVYSDAVEDKIDILSGTAPAADPNLKNLRWHAIKILENDKEVREKYPIRLDDLGKTNLESEIINQKYTFIEEIISEVLVNRDEKSARTDRVDAILTHRIWGIPSFCDHGAGVFSDLHHRRLAQRLF